MTALRDYAVTCVAKGVSVNLNSGAKQTIFTVPTGKTFIPVFAIMRGASATAATGVLDFGGNANADDWINAVALTNLNGTSAEIFIELDGGLDPVTGGTPKAANAYAAATAFGCFPATLVAATSLVDLFGYLV